MAGPKTKIRTTPNSDKLDNIVGWCAQTILASNKFPELIHYSKYKHPNTLLNYRGKNKDINMSKNTGFQPDGGTFCFKETPMKPEICYEAKFQGKGGQAGPDLAYKNILILLNPKCGLNPKGKMVIIASGPGADANPEGITKAEKGKFQCFKDLVYQMFGDSVEVLPSYCVSHDGVNTAYISVEPHDAMSKREATKLITGRDPFADFN